MLKYLHIENIAVIESTDIELNDGFNVLTGETGAGKSIIIDSLNAVLGERTSKELIRKGCEKAEVSALFGEISEHTKEILAENGFEADEDGNVLICRVLSQSGNGTVKINGKPATMGIIREIGKSLVNIHGQHDNQGLLNPENHFNYIDRLADNSELLDSYYKEFKNLNSIRRQLASVECDEDEKARRIKLLQFQIDELTAAQIKVGEVQQLKRSLAVAENREKAVKMLNFANMMLSGDENDDGAISKTDNAKKFLSSIEIDEYSPIVARLEEVSESLSEISEDIRKELNSDDFSNIDTESINNRLDELYTLMLKYGNSEEQMLDFLEDAKAQLESINLSQERAEELAKELDLSTERLVELGERLTASRLLAAEDFSKKVTEALKFLDMQDAEFSVNYEKGRYTKFGCDNIEFYIRTNVGEVSKPLCKIASGGELSRVMLGIKSVLANKDDVDTLVFDEIDVGISGRAAGKVGIQLKKVSDCRQVICVTHLAQIAACAGNHLLIKKSVANGRTYTEVVLLDYEKRIEELSRIMSGTDMTENLYNSAKELLDRSF